MKSASQADFRRPLEHLSRPHIARDIGLRSWAIIWFQKFTKIHKNSQKLTKIDKNSQNLTKIPKTLHLLFSG